MAYPSSRVEATHPRQPGFNPHTHPCCVNLDSTLTLTHAASTFLSQVEGLFFNPKVWSELGLIALFKSCNHGHGDGSSVDLSFGLRKMDGEPPSPKALRIPAKLQNPNTAAPPPGVPTASLSSVTITLQFEPGRSKQLYTSSTENATEEIWPQSRFMNSVTPLLQFMGTVIDDPSVAAFEEELQGVDDGWEFPHVAPVHNNPVLEDDSSTQTFNKLLDMGFRSRIVPNPASVDRGIKTVKNEDVTHLSSLAPALFSRGYSDAMNYRSQFIPSIAKSLASLVDKSRNPASQQRVSVLKSRLFPQESAETPNLRPSIKSALWRIAQKRVYNPRTSRYLSPLQSAATRTEEPPMLDHFSESAEMGFDSDLQAHIDDDDQYLGTDTDGEEFEFLDDGDDMSKLDPGDSTNVSMTMLDSNSNTNNDDGGDSSTDMLDFDFENPCTSQGACHNEPALSKYLELAPSQYNLLYQSKTSDSEILTSDSVEENLGSTLVFGAETVNDMSLDEDELDDMLEDIDTVTGIWYWDCALEFTDEEELFLN